MKTLIALLLILCLVAPTAAQPDLLAAVEDALADLDQQTSYRVAGSQIIAQSITGTNPVEQRIEQNLTGALRKTGDSLAAQLTIQQAVQWEGEGVSPLDFAQTIGLVVLPDTLYMRVSDVSPADLAAIFPGGWVNLTETPDVFPGADLIQPAAYLSLLTRPLSYGLAAALDAEELSSETLAGQDLRVIQITFDPALLLTGDGLTRVAGALDYAQLGADGLFSAAQTDTTITATLWIAPDGRLHRVDQTMTFVGRSAEGGTLDTRISTSLTFTDYDAALSIQPPGL